MGPWVFFLFVPLVVGVLVYGLYRAAQRRKALRAWAVRNGLSFDPSHDGSMDERFPDFGCLHQGGDRYGYNCMIGPQRGRTVLAFDYHYETGSGKDRTSHHFSAVILASGVPLKPLHIRSEGFFDRVGEFFGFDDIDFESAEFSREFRVTSPDRRWAYDVIHARMMAYLLAAPRMSIQFDSGHVIVWQGGRTFSPAQFTDALELAGGILDRLPNYLVQQQKERT